MRNVVAGVFFMVAAFVLAAVGFVVVKTLFGQVFGALFRMFGYHEEHPFQYIAIVAVVFGIVCGFGRCLWK